MKAVWGTALLCLCALLAAPAAAHEERLLLGKVETIDVARKRLVVVGAEGGERRRLEMTPETEALACRAVPGLTAVSAGALVRVKYVEKVGSPSRAESVLVLGGGR
ncbi:MAG: hypothetical protein FJZ38_13730 [Candidatus Rokubacteria bacterium]|nr:hypothetical protein [Candidatus Rokubacteria bacterium]